MTTNQDLQRHRHQPFVRLSRAWFVFLFCVSLAPTLAAQSQLELKYKAYVAGTLAGQARLVLQQRADQFSIVGNAKAEGLMETFSPWRADFTASGRRVERQWQLDEYHYFERDHRKTRVVTVADGELSVIKNGKQRPLRPALPGVDVLTALFVDSRCLPQLDLHTGRHAYRLVQPESENRLASSQTDQAEQCEYEATDEDGDRNQVKIVFADVEGQRVPKLIVLSGWLSGRMELVRHATKPAKVLASRADHH